MIEAALYDLLNESIKVEKLLTQTEVSDYFSRTAVYDNRFTRRDVSYSFGSGPKSCLIYTFGEPGEAGGGTGLVTLANLLQRGTCNFRNMPVTWHFAPGLDVLTDTGISTFRAIIKELQPDFIFAVSDNYSNSPEQPVRFFAKIALPDKHSNMIRSMFVKSGVELAKSGADPHMGPGFYLASTNQNPLLAEIPTACQFLHTVFGRMNDLLPADLVFLQMATGLIGIDSITQSFCDIKNAI